MFTVYTLKDLKKRSTTQLIAIYNRLFNTNVWEETFNPYSERQSIILEIYAEMNAMRIAAVSREENSEPEERKPYRPLQITVSAEHGFVIVWTALVVKNNRKYEESMVWIIRNMFEHQGETPSNIAKILGMPRNRVYRICRYEVYADL